MSVQTEITRLSAARNTIRNKMVALGLGLSTDKIDALATKLDAVVNQGAVSASVKEGETYTIPAGYHNGSGTVAGVAGGGSYTLLSTKTATPTKSSQTITSDDGYYGLSSVTVNPIPDAYQDVSSVTATAADVLTTKTFVASDGTATAGTMPNQGSVSQTLNTTTTSYTIPKGYHDGTGKVSITTETKTATPTTSQLTITPTSGKVLSQVTVSAIPSKYADASSSTVTAAGLLTGQTAIGYNSSTGAAVTIEGSMADNGAVSQVLDTTTTSYTVPAGYHNGSGKVSISLETKTATPSTSTQNITPTSGKVLSQVTVNPIPSNYGNATGMTATTGDILSGKTALGVNSSGQAVTLTGTMANNGATGGTLNTTTTSYTIPAGYTSGGTVSITTETKSATPTTSSQDITPSTGKVLSKVTVAAIPAAYGNASSTTVTAANLLDGVTAIGYDSTNSKAVTVEGTMTNNGAVAATITGLGSVTGDTSYTIPAGYHNGSGTVSLTSDIENALAAI